jgi:imidazolonepropionase-like amidohydrolase
MAIEAEDKGVIKPGAVADFVVLEADSYVEIPYRPGTDLVRIVIKNGKVVAG